MASERYKVKDYHPYHKFKKDGLDKTVPGLYNVKQFKVWDTETDEVLPDIFIKKADAQRRVDRLNGN